MAYLAELYYLQDRRDFPFRKAVSVTATTVGRWSSHFSAEVIVTGAEDVARTRKRGPLPAGPEEKATFVAELVDWIFENSMADALFRLWLDDEPEPRSSQAPKFDHHDDSGSWVLNLTEREFAELQTAWKVQGLPQDLFYPEEETRCVPYPGPGMKARVLRFVGVQKCYTPKQWEKRKRGGE
jgi:hypothetical protein